MAWWDRSWRVGTSRSEDLSFPAKIEIISGSLIATIFAHDLPTADTPLPCWTFVSDGLIAHGQKEMVLTVSRSADEDHREFGAEVLKFLRTVYLLAAQGRRVDVGGFSEFASSGGPGSVRGVGYLRPERITGVDIPLSSLAAIPLVGEEMDAVKAFGLTRVMARLGAHYRYYPCPLWWERKRPVVAAHLGDDASVLGKLAHANLPGVSGRIEGHRIVLRFHPTSRDALGRALGDAPPNVALALVLQPDLEADGLLIWLPGQRQMSAITPPGSRGRRLSLCFLGLAAGQAQDVGRILEDGAVVLLTEASWSHLRAAIDNGEPLTIECEEEGYSLALECIADTYVSPLDGRAYPAEGGWRTYYPRASRPRPPNGIFRVTAAVMLTSDDDLAQRASPVLLAAYTDRIVEVIQGHFGTRGDITQLVLRVELFPAGEVHVSAVGNVDGRLVITLIEALEPPPVRGGPVRFELLLATSDDGEDSQR